MKKKTLIELGEVYRMAPAHLCRLRKQGAPIEQPAEFWRWMDERPGRKPGLYRRMMDNPAEAGRIAAALYTGPSLLDAFRAAIELPE